MFDLDITNYSIKDLEQFFKLKPPKYTAQDVELKEYKIRETLLASGNIDKRFKTGLIEFLSAAKDLLIYRKLEKTDNHNQPFTTIPKNYKLDPYVETPKLKNAENRESELLKRPETQFVYTNTSDYFPGTLNPLNTRVITKCINIDTRFRDNLTTGQCSDFTIQLPVKLNKVVSMQLASIEFPVCFYTISQFYGNNFIKINVVYMPIDSTNSVATNTSTTLIVPDGNYNANDLISLLNAQLSPKNLDNSVINANSIFSYIQFSLDITETGSGSGKVTISPTGAFANNVSQIIMDFTKDIHGNDDLTTPKLGANLGFIKPNYTGSISYVAETIIDTASVRYVYLAVDDFSNRSNNHFISVFNDTYMSPDILARISINGSYYSLIMENNLNIISEPRSYFGPVDIQKMRIRLFDDRGRILQMNNSNFSFCLNVKLLYDL
jgi:hypothetical protein